MQHSPLTEDEQKIADGMRSWINVANAVTDARMKLGLTLPEVARRAKVKYAIAERIEDGTKMHTVRFGDLDRIATALGLEITLERRQDD